MKFLPIFISVIMSSLLFLSHFPQASAKCCWAVCRKCDDCERENQYCGRGACNLFGCNCEGGCRSGPCRSPRQKCHFWRGKRDLFSNDLEEADTYKYENVSQIIEKADRNFDGKLDLVEAVGFLKLKTPVSVHLEETEIERAFKELDKNRDQFLSSSEIDKF